VKLNILYAGTLPPHQEGSALSCSQILIGLAALGHRIRAVASITPEALRAGDAFAQAARGIAVSRFLVPCSLPSSPVEGEYRRRERVESKKLVVRLLADERPDLLLIGRESFAWELPALAERHSLPCVAMVRGGTTMELLGEAQPAGRQLLEQLSKVDLIATPAVHLAERLTKAGLTNTTVVPNAIDIRRFRPRPRNRELADHLRVAREDIVVGHLSTLTERKRPLDIVASAVGALRQCRNLVYVIVGDGPLRTAMQGLCAANGIASRVRFVDWVPYEAVPDYVNLADIVLMPSTAEGLARVYLETQACGRTLVASDIAAAREAVVDGKTGLLFRTGDVHDLTVKTVLAASDVALRAEIGRAGREHVKRRSLEAAVAAYDRLLVDVVR
jgi:glycosyltransferase involved in cell wall biosynthesis